MHPCGPQPLTAAIHHHPAARPDQLVGKRPAALRWGLLARLGALLWAGSLLALGSPTARAAEPAEWSVLAGNDLVVRGLRVASGTHGRVAGQYRLADGWSAGGTAARLMEDGGGGGTPGRHLALNLAYSFDLSEGRSLSLDVQRNWYNGQAAARRWGHDELRLTLNGQGPWLLSLSKLHSRLPSPGFRYDGWALDGGVRLALAPGLTLESGLGWLDLGGFASGRRYAHGHLALLGQVGRWEWRLAHVRTDSAGQRQFGEFAKPRWLISVGTAVFD